MIGAHENDSERADAQVQENAPVQLMAQVLPDGRRYIAVVDGLELEGAGPTPDAAQESLVQAVRSWLERLDTTGKLGDALGVECLEEETEIVLQFIDGNDGNRELSD